MSGQQQSATGPISGDMQQQLMELAAVLPALPHADWERARTALHALLECVERVRSMEVDAPMYVTGGESGE